MQRVDLETERLRLSAPTADDVDAIFAACQDPLIQRYTTVPQPYPREAAESFVRLTGEWWDAGTEANWAIRHDGEFAGMIGVFGLDPAGGGTGEIGYWMAPGHRGRGILTEAATVVVDHALAGEGLALDRLQWRAVVGNTASGRTARALGFRYEGILRAALVNGGGVRDDGWIAALLPADDRTPQPWPVLVNP